MRTGMGNTPWYTWSIEQMTLKTVKTSGLFDLNHPKKINGLDYFENLDFIHDFSKILL